MEREACLLITLNFRSKSLFQHSACCCSKICCSKPWASPFYCSNETDATKLELLRKFPSSALQANVSFSSLGKKDTPSTFPYWLPVSHVQTFHPEQTLSLIWMETSPCFYLFYAIRQRHRFSKEQTVSPYLVTGCNAPVSSYQTYKSLNLAGGKLGWNHVFQQDHNVLTHFLKKVVQTWEKGRESGEV